MSKYSDSIKSTAEFFKEELKVFNFSFIGTSIYITLVKENVDLFDSSLLKEVKHFQCSSFINGQKILHDNYESAIKDLSDGKSECILISAETKLPLFNKINAKFVEIYKS